MILLLLPGPPDRHIRGLVAPEVPSERWRLDEPLPAVGADRLADEDVLPGQRRNRVLLGGRGQPLLGRQGEAAEGQVQEPRGREEGGCQKVCVPRLHRLLHTIGWGSCQGHYKYGMYNNGKGKILQAFGFNVRDTFEDVREKAHITCKNDI